MEYEHLLALGVSWVYLASILTFSKLDRELLNAVSKNHIPGRNDYKHTSKKPNS